VFNAGIERQRLHSGCFLTGIDIDDMPACRAQRAVIAATVTIHHGRKIGLTYQATWLNENASGREIVAALCGLRSVLIARKTQRQNQ